MIMTTQLLTVILNTIHVYRVYQYLLTTLTSTLSTPKEVDNRYSADQPQSCRYTFRSGDCFFCFNLDTAMMPTIIRNKHACPRRVLSSQLPRLCREGGVLPTSRSSPTASCYMMHSSSVKKEIETV